MQFTCTAASAAKAIKLPVIANIHDKGIAEIKITQDKATKIYQIRETLNKYTTSIAGMYSYLQKHMTAYGVPSTEDNRNHIDTSRATTSTIGILCPSTVTGKESM